jgi:hypothetical protein
MQEMQVIQAVLARVAAVPPVYLPLQQFQEILHFLHLQSPEGTFIINLPTLNMARMAATIALLNTFRQLAAILRIPGPVPRELAGREELVYSPVAQAIPVPLELLEIHQVH